MSTSCRHGSPDYGTTTSPDASQPSLRPWQTGAEPHLQAGRCETSPKRTKLGMLWGQSYAYLKQVSQAETAAADIATVTSS